jgi:hypothetical protein
MQDLKSPDEFATALATPGAVLLKHGATCGISAAARDALAAFSAEHPDVPVFGVEVTGQRAISDLVAERLARRQGEREAGAAARREARPRAAAERLDGVLDDAQPEPRPLDAGDRLACARNPRAKSPRASPRARRGRCPSTSTDRLGRPAGPGSVTWPRTSTQRPARRGRRT